MAITLPQRVIPSTDVLFQEVGGEIVLLNLANESYFGLDAVGARLWLLLNGDADFEKAVGAMLQEYEVGPEVLRSDLSELVRQMAEAGLVRIE